MLLGRPLHTFTLNKDDLAEELLESSESLLPTLAVYFVTSKQVDKSYSQRAIYNMLNNIPLVGILHRPPSAKYIYSCIYGMCYKFAEDGIKRELNKYGLKYDRRDLDLILDFCELYCTWLSQKLHSTLVVTEQEVFHALELFRRQLKGNER